MQAFMVGIRIRHFILGLTFVFPLFAVEQGRAELHWSGNLSMEMRSFRYEAENAEQTQNYGSLALKPELFYAWNNGKQSITFSGFARVSDANDARTHFDIRELAWTRASEQWELRAGIRKVFWGVTESQHLADIINQTDAPEGIDGDEKLGQPMLNLALIQNWGTLDFFILPIFRPRQFTGSDGRLRLPLPVDTAATQYDSPETERHVDFAARWSRFIGNWDIGLSHFYGTSREPRLLIEPTVDGPVLRPYYDLIHQTAIDLQATTGSWLWKAEAIRRSGMARTFFAATAGLEYSLFNFIDSGMDLGIVMEYMFDDRNRKATNPFNNDILFALRFNLNDEQSTDALIGFIYDLDEKGNVITIEAGRRLGESYKLKLESKLFFDFVQGEILYGLSKDDYVQLDLGYYF